jgi:opacity protein-like surface antigen
MKCLTLVVLAALALTPAVAAAQARNTSGAANRTWEVEVHVGGIGASNPSDGETQLPAAGPAFQTTFGLPSRRVSSWYFGDGSTLLNSANGTLGVSGRVTPLDSALNAPLVNRKSGVIFGARVGRQLTPRVSAEFSFEYSSSKLELTDDAIAGIEATRASFTAAWNGLMTSGPYLSNNVTSTADLVTDGGKQYVTTGAVNVALATQGRLTPYVTGGGGIISSTGDKPQLDLTGNYRFAISSVPINETDSVRIRIDEPDHRFALVLGGGIKYAVSDDWGIRVEFRDLISSGKTRTLLSATPSVALGSPQGVISTVTIPSVQFSNISAVPSTLSGSAITDFQTFESSGTRHHVTFTSGVFWRF